jgi:hypothetical protein
MKTNQITSIYFSFNSSTKATVCSAAAKSQKEKTRSNENKERIMMISRPKAWR